MAKKRSYSMVKALLLDNLLFSLNDQLQKVKFNVNLQKITITNSNGTPTYLSIELVQKQLRHWSVRVSISASYA